MEIHDLVVVEGVLFRDEAGNTHLAINHNGHACYLQHFSRGGKGGFEDYPTEEKLAEVHHSVVEYFREHQEYFTPEMRLQ